MHKAKLPLPSGFFASGVSAGLKPGGRPDLALLYSKFPCEAAGLVTRNTMRGAPARLTSEALRRGDRIQAIVVNTKYSNSLTGHRGRADALAVAARAAKCLHIHPSRVLSHSTGVIGVPMPLAKVLGGVDRAVKALSHAGAMDAAKAILTTDRTVKASTCAFVIGRKICRVTGFAKGSGMIHPNMGTMLVYLVTDVKISRGLLQRILREAAEESFHRITVDGDTSTNDSVVVLANGSGRNKPIRSGTKAYRQFSWILKDICLDLSKAIVWDGEGATKYVKVRVEGAASKKDAKLAAMAVARSPLVKTALFGADPNWGRILAAVGYSGARASEWKARVAIGGYTLYDGGRNVSWSRAKLKRILKHRSVDIRVNLGMGRSAVTVYTCDLSHGYVDINGKYTT